MSDEEKKAIEKFKKLKDYKYIYYGYTWFKLEACADDEMKRNIDIILNLIEKQSKEIEELKEKDTANLAYYDQIYQNGIYTGQKAVEYKIKAKIEEYSNTLKKLNKKNDIERIKGINERILAFKEIL